MHAATHPVRQVTDSLILITLLIQLGVWAAVSSSLTLGVWIRVRETDFLAGDISFEATILMGLLLGPAAAMLGGAALSVPAVWHGEYWTLPVNLTVAAIMG